MRKIKDFNEDRLPFLNKNENRAIDFSYENINDPIPISNQYHSLMLQGVANQLMRWPNDLSSSFMAACLIISSFLLLVFVTAIFCSPVTKECNRCELKSPEDECSSNVYFVKEAGQAWSGKDFCCIEAAAKKQPNLNIHLINLMRAANISNTTENNFKITLASRNPNIHIADLSIDEFFSKTELSSIAKNLSNESLLIAAKAYLLWNFSGIAMHPSAYCNLSNINKSRWNKVGKRDCTPDELVTIDPMIDLQATDVYCQAFLGFLIREISKNATRVYTLKDALNKFCPRIDNCPEVRIVDLKSQCPVDASDCPTVHNTYSKSWKHII